MTPINKYVLIKVRKPIAKIGSLVMPDIGQRRMNTGDVIGFSNKLEGKLSIGDMVWFMEYKDSMWIDNEVIVVPYMSLNAKMTNGLTPIQATGSKILVLIDKQKQKNNRLIGSLKLLMPDFNNTFTYNNQFGECLSIGPDVEEYISLGDMALFNQFIELSQEHFITEINKDNTSLTEIRAVECGSGFNYELFGYCHNNQFISTKNYVFVKDGDNGDAAIRQLAGSKLVVVEKEKSAYDFKYFTVLHKTDDNRFNPGDMITARGKSAKCGSLDIHYVATDLVSENLSQLVHDGYVEIKEDRINITGESR